VSALGSHLKQMKLENSKSGGGGGGFEGFGNDFVPDRSSAENTDGFGGLLDGLKPGGAAKAKYEGFGSRPTNSSNGAGQVGRAGSHTDSRSKEKPGKGKFEVSPSSQPCKCFILIFVDLDRVLGARLWAQMRVRD